MMGRYIWTEFGGKGSDCWLRGGEEMDMKFLDSFLEVITLWGRLCGLRMKVRYEVRETLL